MEFRLHCIAHFFCAHNKMMANFLLQSFTVIYFTSPIFTFISLKLDFPFIL